MTSEEKVHLCSGCDVPVDEEHNCTGSQYCQCEECNNES